MIKWLVAFSFFVFTCFSCAQNYSVASFQKINELYGGFSGNLDANDNFAISIDNIGDLNGDGINDVAVGAYTDDDGGTDKGAVWILFLDASNQVISHTKISNTSGNFTGSLDPNDRFGGAVAYLGDLNNDGLIELAVGADYDGDGGFWHGAVWILSLNSDGTVNSHTKISDTQGGFTGFINGDAIFGTDIENIGDLNGDGIQDLAVGSRRDADGGSRRGAVWILFMNADFTVNNYQKISDTQGNFFAPLAFEDYFGGSVANVGDLDQDGVTDIVVGAYRDDDQNTNSGSFYVLFLNSNGTVKNYQKVSNLSGGFNGTISTDALFGESIDGVVDIDNDGKIEIVVGALRQQNPTTLLQTGAFFLIELNADGTVSEERMYTFGENCFSGNLNSGDFFGGAVTVLNDAGTIRFAVGAYKDSENGNDKGAVWILELGELSFTIEATQNPTSCSTNDGEIALGNLSPNTTYNIAYELNGTMMTQTVTSNVSGEASIVGLSVGNYTNIVVGDNTIGCSENLGAVSLSGNLNANYVTQDPSMCGAADASILISNLGANITYQITYQLDGVQEVLNATSDASGEILISNLTGGVYASVEVTNTNLNCMDALGDIFIDQPAFVLTFTETDISSCNASNGTILISGLVPNQAYVVDYSYQSNLVQNTYNADANGEILLTNLSEGLYESIMVVDTVSPCTDGIGMLEIEGVSLVLTANTTDPSGCGINDGEITLQGASANENYTISYNLNGTTETITVSSDASGVITINNLGAGTYTSIVVEEIATNCITTVNDQVLQSTDITFTTSVTDPSGCGINDGEIILQGASVNETYTVSYNLNGTTDTITVSSDASGVITINNLGAGTYTSIVVEEIATNCITTVNDQVLQSTDITFTTSVTDPSGCGINDGEIILQGGSANENYVVSYNLNGTTETLTISSDASGVIMINNLGAGTYTSIVVEEISTNCITTVNDQVLQSTNLTLIPNITHPSECEVNDGTIAFQGATANATYTVSYELNGITNTVSTVANTQGAIVLENLPFGEYLNIVVEENLTGCADMFASLQLTCEDETEQCFRVRKFFTPNNDGYNDGWYLEDVQGCNYIVHIFNRYGKLIKTLTPRFPAWDGTYRGKALPSSDYWILINYTRNDQAQTYITNITLRR
ncbi:T9SS type B sorting domain-containing protein [Kordia zhangzhouensis]|uniref:T9SS type B sorting domain-containing protein n=1 Tax=Kordia zhangzhouensis TaxID=1620405 RepID=UPI0006297446|nr:T9SS type B sorting domain-containing protein [Kordia zhangzhouensis]